MSGSPMIDEDDIDARNAALEEAMVLSDEPAYYANSFRMQAFSDDTIRLNLGECITTDYTAPRGCFRIPMAVACQLHQILGETIALARTEREAAAAKKEKMN